AALGDRVDAAAGEAALTHVVRRDHELDFLDRVERDRLRFRGAARRARRAREAEQVVVHGAIDLQRVVAITVAGNRERGGTLTSAAALRDEERADAGDVGQAAGNRRQVFFDLIRDVVGGAGPGEINLRALRDDLDGLADRRQLQLEIDGALLPERDVDR